jgi:aryl-alcohol dehydrogenase-like predicted oxidoreductase
MLHLDIDTAYIYTKGKSETFLGTMLGNSAELEDGSADADLFQFQADTRQSVRIATKACPYKPEKLSLSKAHIQRQLASSLTRLDRKQVHLFYLHQPDHVIPIEESLKAVNELHQQGFCATIYI